LRDLPTPARPHSFPTRRSSDLWSTTLRTFCGRSWTTIGLTSTTHPSSRIARAGTRHRISEVCSSITVWYCRFARANSCKPAVPRSEEHTSELQSHLNLVCRLLL